MWATKAGLLDGRDGEVPLGGAGSTTIQLSTCAVEGASRWARVGTLSIQPSLILVPLLVLAFARAKDWLSTSGVLVASLALALQPDRGMAGALVAGMVAIALLRPDRMTIMAVVGATAGFGSTLAHLPAQGITVTVLANRDDSTRLTMAIAEVLIETATEEP
jgi:cell division protein FtsW (lipid II flippase)